MDHLRGIASYFLMFPAILIGTIAMASYGVPSSIWLQNIIIWIVGTVLSFIFLIKGRNKNSNHSIYTIIFVVLLVFPFFFNGLDGVHRWLTFGSINIYIASMILPVFIIYLWKLSLNNHKHYIIGLTFTTLLIL